jgi:hypothetical protein
LLFDIFLSVLVDCSLHNRPRPNTSQYFEQQKQITDKIIHLEQQIQIFDRDIRLFSNKPVQQLSSVEQQALQQLLQLQTQLQQTKKHHRILEDQSAVKVAIHVLHVFSLFSRSVPFFVRPLWVRFGKLLLYIYIYIYIYRKLFNKNIINLFIFRCVWFFMDILLWVRFGKLLLYIYIYIYIYICVCVYCRKLFK